MDEGVSDSSRYPRPTSASAPIGFDASSPHNVTGLPAASPLSATAFKARRIGEDKGSNRSATRRLLRSTA